jgi:hypothetical protein
MFGECGYDAGLVDHAALDACRVERGFVVKLVAVCLIVS